MPSAKNSPIKNQKMPAGRTPFPISRRISFPSSHDLMLSRSHALVLLCCCSGSATALLRPNMQQTLVNIDLLRPGPIFRPLPACRGGIVLVIVVVLDPWLFPRELSDPIRGRFFFHHSNTPPFPFFQAGPSFALYTLSTLAITDGNVHKTRINIGFVTLAHLAHLF